MSARWSAPALALVLGGLALAAAARPAHAGPPVLAIEFRPAADDLQIAVWLESPQGRFLRTLFITRAVGTFGIGNRPGRFDLKSGFRWPYGRRTNALPVWAHRHGKTYPLVVFQDARDGSVAYHEEDSSAEAYFCRPTQRTEQFCYRRSENEPCQNAPYPLTSHSGPAPDPVTGVTVDAITCPSVANLSKGRLDPERTTVYPPRNDVTAFNERVDHPSIMGYATLNELDAVSRATPPARGPYHVFVPLKELPDGEYVAYVEVNREFDQNESHDYPDHPDDETIWDSYGTPHLGQPSVIYRLPLSIKGGQVKESRTSDYVGYGAWDGADGEIRPPDGTISDTPGSGAGRLAVLSDEQGSYRVRAVPAAEILPKVPGPDGGPAPDGGSPGDGGGPGPDFCDPIPPGGLEIVRAEPGTVTLGVVTPADTSRLLEYDLRYRVGQPIDEGNIDGATPGPMVPVGAAGERVEVTVGGLKPQTHYFFALRTRGLCNQLSGAVLADVQTPRTPYATIKGCFVATAAYGSSMAPEVDRLRRVRDRVLLRSRLGRALVGAYYAVSPPVAAVIARDESLRRAARSLLVPVVDGTRLLGL